MPINRTEKGKKHALKTNKQTNKQKTMVLEIRDLDCIFNT